MKHYLITGATSGLGLDLAKKLSSNSKLTLIGRDFTKINLRDFKFKSKKNFNLVEYDLRDLDGISNLINSATQMLGPLDGFVHSAGILNVVPLKGIRPNVAIDMYKVNVLSALMITKEIRKAKNHNKSCSIVLISSIVHKAGNPGQAIYSATKGALVSMAKSLSLELIKDKIRINTVSPAAIETEMVFTYKQTVPVSALEDLRSKHPMGFGKAKDVTSAVKFLLSTQSSWITGSDMIVDGGYSAQ